MAIRTVASEPPLLCGSAGTQVAIETRRFGERLLRVHVDESVHTRVHLTDQLQVSDCDLLGGELAREHQPGELAHCEAGDLAIVP